MAEWLKALVLKTRDGNIRKFESCPFRQKISPEGLFFSGRFSGADVSACRCVCGYYCDFV